MKSMDFWFATMKTFRRILLAAAALPLFLSFAVPVQAQALTGGVQVDSIAAIVNNDVITRRELDQRVGMIEHRLETQNAPMPPADQLQRQVLEQLVLDRVQLQKAKEDGINITDAQVAQTLQRLAAANNMSLPDYQQRIEAQGVPWSMFTNDARTELTLTQLRQQEVDSKITVSDAEVANYLATQPSTGASTPQGGSQVIQQTHVEHILLRVGNGVSEDDARRRLLEIKQKIEQGGDFAAFARSFSQDASASQGGDLGWVSPGETVPDFERAMNALQPGQISDPVRTEYGYHLIEVIGRRQQKVTAEQDQDAARQAIGTRKSDQAYDDWLRQLRDTAYIQYKIGGPPADSQQAATN
jgi:peptidyl-prolyl cis-trans isomerase SurA